MGWGRRRRSARNGPLKAWWRGRADGLSSGAAQQRGRQNGSPASGMRPNACRRIARDSAMHGLCIWRGMACARMGTDLRGSAIRWFQFLAHEDFALEMDAVRAHVSAPTLLFWGKESWSTHPGEDGRASAIPDHKIVAYQDAGHWLHHDQAERLYCRCADIFAWRALKYQTRRPTFTRSAPFSPIMMLAAFVLLDTTVGMTEASMTRSLLMPRTRSDGSTTAMSSDPMRAVPE